MKISFKTYGNIKDNVSSHVKETGYPYVAMD
jgi:hypothetical protein